MNDLTVPFHNTRIVRQQVVKLLLSCCISTVVLVLPQSTQAQGIHITLRANPTPRVSRRYADVWADGNYAYVCSDVTSGVLIFDISNPDAPVQVANYAPANSQNMEDAKVSNGIGYFASNNGGGVHIVDLSDPTQPVLITRITAATGGYDYIHNVVIDGTHLYFPNYAPSGSPAVQVWDVSNPALPFLIRTIMTTDPKFIHDMTVENNRLYTAGNGATTDIWDVTNVDTQAPVLLGTINSGTRTASAVPSSDGKFLFVTRELFNFAGDLSVYDISNPANAQLVYQTTGAPLGLDATSAFQPKVVNNLLYLTWDQAGLVVFDITNPASPVLIGNYDTWPATANGSLFDGGWGVYPFLGQDRVLVSDRNTGLYILNATAVSAQPALLNIKASPVSVTGPLPATGQVFIVGQGSSPDGTNISLSSNNSAASVPAVVTIPAGGTTATFTIDTTTVTAPITATITASDGVTSKTGRLTVNPAPPDFAISINNSPQSVLASQQGAFTGTLTSIAGYAAPVNLSCMPGATSPPSTCTISQPVTPIATGAPFTVMVSATSAGNYNFKVRAVGTDSLSTSHSAAAALNVGADFQFSNNTGSRTVRPGIPAQYTLSFAPVGSPTFANAVTYSCSHLPPLSSCSFSPPQIAAGSATVTVMFTVTTTAPISSVRLWDNRHETDFFYALWLSLPAFGIIFVGGATHKSRSFRRIGQCAALAILLAAAFLQVSCGGGGGTTRPNPKPGTPLGQYTVNIDANSGSTSHSDSVTLTVQ